MTIPRLHCTSTPYGERGPKIKQPTLPKGDFDVALCAQVITLLVANASLASPRSGLVWWGDESVAEVEAAMRALVSANPKVLKIEDRTKSPTPALEIVRVEDFENIATIYTTARSRP